MIERMKELLRKYTDQTKCSCNFSHEIWVRNSFMDDGKIRYEEEYQLYLFGETGIKATYKGSLASSVKWLEDLLKLPQ